MTLFKKWNDLMENQTDDTFEAFWKEYSETETRIYADILKNKTQHFEGVFSDLVAKYEADPVIFMGFLDGIQTSLEAPIDLKKVDESTNIVMDIIWDKLFFNMLAAEADYLYGLEEWDGIYTIEERKEIADTWRRSRTVVKEKLPGRNDPCPCGSGKKYKKCCGANK